MKQRYLGLDYSVSTNSRSQEVPEHQQGNPLETLADTSNRIISAIKAVQSVFPSAEVSSKAIILRVQGMDDSVYFTVGIETPQGAFREVTSLFIGLAGVPLCMRAAEGYYGVINEVLRPHGKCLSTRPEDSVSLTRTIRDL